MINILTSLCFTSREHAPTPSLGETSEFHKLSTYLEVLVGSIYRVYRPGEVVVSVANHNVNDKTMRILKTYPGLELKKIPFSSLGDVSYNKFYSYRGRNVDIPNHAYLDADMLLIGKLDSLFEEDFDVAFVLNPPGSSWALTTSTVLTKDDRNPEGIRRFFMEWEEATIGWKTGKRPLPRGQLIPSDHTFVVEYLGGPEKVQEKATKGGLVFRGFPQHVLNCHMEPAPDTKIVHLKSPGRVYRKAFAAQVFPLWSDIYHRSRRGYREYTNE